MPKRGKYEKLIAVGREGGGKLSSIKFNDEQSQEFRIYWLLCRGAGSA